MSEWTGTARDGLIENMSNDLPICPEGSHWDITGTPQGPWVWSSGIHWNEDGNEYAVSAEPWAVASAPGATAIWVADRTR